MMRLAVMKKLFGLAAGLSAFVWFSNHPAYAQPANLAAISVPVNQRIAPAGKQVDLPGARPQVLALSPDGTLLAVLGKNSLFLIDPANGALLQTTPLPADTLRGKANIVSEQILHPDARAQASYAGMVFSAEGTRVYLSNVEGDVKVLSIEAGKARPLHSLALPPCSQGGRKVEIPAGLALSADGKRLYVAGNLSNRLIELDTTTGKTLRTFDTGALPYDVVLKGRKAYVSNWGGRRPEAGSITGPAGRGTQVRVDPTRFIASEGSVSVINLDSGSSEKEILTGMHACAMAMTRNGHYLAVANSGSDTVSVLDTENDTVIETISLRWQPKDLFGASPNALAFNAQDNVLYVCNGTQNAIAVVEFKPRHSKLTGLIPTGWYPGAVAFSAKHAMLCVANIKGIGSGKTGSPGERLELNTHQYRGTVSLISAPDSLTLKLYTGQVLENYRHAAMEKALLPPRPGVPARAVPERVGEPSFFKHVIYIIKENRTYDQVLGDLKEGNGDERLCIFGEKVTPNQHKIARDFVLLDNIRCSGVLSADGHQWTDSAMANDYIEKAFTSFPRSYPYFGDDAMAYSSAGFIWDNALAHGKTLRNYGEFVSNSLYWKDPKHRGTPTRSDCYRDFTNSAGLIQISSQATIDSLKPYTCKATSGFELRVPDLFRARVFLEEFKAFEKNGNLPNFIIMMLPCDHTSGTKPGSATPAAMVADNDLALGQIIEAVSQSRYWKDTCIFVIEDDPQNGFDHVSSYRTTAFIASPYTRRNQVVHTEYNQTSLLRTMELMLGLPPLNQIDATADPMFDCFTDTPDFAAFEAVPNQVPLDQTNPALSSIKDPMQKKYAIASARLPLEEADECPEDLFNRILWHAQKGSAMAYPSWAVGTRE